MLLHKVKQNAVSIYLIMVFTLIMGPMLEGSQIEYVEQEPCPQSVELLHADANQIDSNESDMLDSVDDEHSQEHHEHHSHTCSSCYFQLASGIFLQHQYNLSQILSSKSAMHPRINPNLLYRPPRTV